MRLSLGQSKSILAILFLHLLSTNLWAADLTRYDQELRRGHDAVYQLDFEGAEKIFKKLIEEHPQSPGAYTFLALTRWNQLLQAAGNLALDDYATPTPFARKPSKPVDAPLQAFLETNQKAIEICDQALASNGDDVRALYFKGVAFENLASEAVAIRKEPWEAWAYGRTATRLHKRVLELDPNLVDAKLSLGVAEFAKATAPWSLRWFTALFYPGDKEHALAAIREVGTRGRFRQYDAQLVLALLQAWKGDPQESVQVFNRLRAKYPTNYLLDMNLAAIQLQNLDSPTQALHTYQRLLAEIESKSGNLKIGEIYYRLGLTYHRLREYQQALNSLEKVIDSPTLEKETIPLSAYWIAQIHEDRAEPAQAARWYRRMLDTAPTGDTLKKELQEARRKAAKLAAPGG